MKISHDAGRNDEPRLPPLEWLELPETKLLLTRLQDELPAGSIQISDGKPGQPKEVFVHHKIAHAYSEYLGGDFHAAFQAYYLKHFGAP